MAELIRGSPVPLFDRLASGERGPGDSGSYLSPEQLQASIARDLSMLLNTRCGMGVAKFAQCEGTTLDYGIPDFGFMSPGSSDDLVVLGATVKRAIALFEPRLYEVDVRVRPPVAGGGPTLEIAGLVKIGLKLRQLNFELQLDPSLTQAARAG